MKKLFIWILSFTCSKLRLEFYKRDGSILESPQDHVYFNIFVFLGERRTILRARSHDFYSPIKMFADPCIYKLYGMFTPGRGSINLCEKKLEFLWNEFLYKVDFSKQSERSLFNFSKGFDVPFEKQKINSNDLLEKTQMNSEIEKKEVIIRNKDFKIDIFIFNEMNRTKQLGKEINKNTQDIFKIVQDIYKETEIVPILKGIININEKIPEFGTPLESFKRMIEPLRFSPFNLRTNLSKSDLIILLTNEDMVQHQGMTFFGGASRLDSSYSLVSIGPKDSTYFVAKKVAHEIAHSLGAEHDIGNGFLMEEITCKTCGEEKRFFSEVSKRQISRFISQNKRVFASSPVLKYKDDEFITTLDQAEEFATERRKHSFIEIVKTKLQGQFPIAMEINPLLSLSILIYGIIIFAVIYFFK